MLNKSIIMGRLTADPETRHTQSGTAVCSFVVAVDRSHKDASGARQTDFIDCAAWGKQAEWFANWFEKGMAVVVVGELRTDTWTDKDGNRRKSTEIHADEITFGETKKARTGHSGAIAG